MSTENEPNPALELTPAPEPTPAAAPAPAATPDEPPAWALKRIDALTQKSRQSEEELIASKAEVEELRRQLAALENGAVPEPAPAPAGGLTEAEVARRAKAEALKLAAAARFEEQCNQLFAKGTAAHNDFDKVLKGFVTLGGLPPQLVQAALEFENPHELIYELGKDLNEASRVIQMTPVQQATALAKLALRKPEISSAPAPVRAVVDNGGGGSAAQYDKNMSMSDYTKMRAAQRAARSA